MATWQLQAFHLLIRIKLIRHNHHRPVATNQLEIIKSLQGNHLSFPLFFVFSRQIIHVIDSSNKMIAKHDLRVKILSTTSGITTGYIKPSVTVRIQHVLSTTDNIQPFRVVGHISQVIVGNQFIGTGVADIVISIIKVLHIGVCTFQPHISLIVCLEFRINGRYILLRHHIQPTVTRHEQKERNK